MSDTETPFKKTMQQKLARVGIFAAVLLIAFLLGLVPMWLKARQCAAEHEITNKQLRKTEVSNLLTSAIVEARRGEYETARQMTSDFFTNLRAADEKGDEGFLTAAQRSAVKPLFANRDATITMLAQRDQAAAERLTDIYVAYRQALGPVPTPAATQPTP